MIKTFVFLVIKTFFFFLVIKNFFFFFGDQDSLFLFFWCCQAAFDYDYSPLYAIGLVNHDNMGIITVVYQLYMHHNVHSLFLR